MGCVERQLFRFNQNEEDGLGTAGLGVQEGRRKYRGIIIVIIKRRIQRGN